ncbi:MAG: VTT domain-containing protein [Hyphomonadaceae bacterium]|nr:VTT domain-containing protein [Hyphomonadaceae bacterium]
MGRRLALLLTVATAMALVWAMGWHRHLTLEAVAANRDTLHAIIAQHRSIAVVAYILVYVATVALSLPGGTAMTLTGGLLFGSFGGAIAAVIGATTGATIVFLIARTAMGDVLASRGAPFLRKLRDGFRENTLSYVLFLRLVPAFPFWLVNLAPAVDDLEIRRKIEVARREQAVVANVQDFAPTVASGALSARTTLGPRQNGVAHALERLGDQSAADRTGRLP